MLKKYVFLFVIFISVSLNSFFGFQYIANKLHGKRRVSAPVPTADSDKIIPADISRLIDHSQGVLAVFKKKYQQCDLKEGNYEMMGIEAGGWTGVQEFRYLCADERGCNLYIGSPHGIFKEKALDGYNCDFFKSSFEKVKSKRFGSKSIFLGLYDAGITTIYLSGYDYQLTTEYTGGSFDSSIDKCNTYMLYKDVESRKDLSETDIEYYRCKNEFDYGGGITCMQKHDMEKNKIEDKTHEYDRYKTDNAELENECERTIMLGSLFHILKAQY